MIVALADDYTGAAEVAGIGHRYGLRAEVQTSLQPTQDDLVVLDTNTRSLPPPEAAAIVAEVGRMVRRLAPHWVFKKVDSVLRGPVLAELEALLGTTGGNGALVVAGNPHSGRTIADGVCRIGGVPLAQTEFAHDPEYPARSSHVLDLLGTGSQPVVVVPVGGTLPPGGIAVGEVTTPADLETWTRAVGEEVLPAGGAAFFAALLEAQGCCAQHTDPTPFPGKPVLVVSGSAAEGARSNLARMAGDGVPVAAMPAALFAGDSPVLIGEWAQAALQGLACRGSAAVVIGGERRAEPGLPSRLCLLTVEVVSLVLQQSPVAHLVIEGGATASAIVRCQRWDRLHAVGEHSPGVVSLQQGTGMLLLTVKPGSYPWPGELLLCLRPSSKEADTA